MPTITSAQVRAAADQLHQSSDRFEKQVTLLHQLAEQMEATAPPPKLTLLQAFNRERPVYFAVRLALAAAVYVARMCRYGKDADGGSGVTEAGEIADSLIGTSLDEANRAPGERRLGSDRED